MVLALPFPFVARLALPLVLRFRLAGRLLFAFELSLAFLFACLRFGLLSLVFVFVFELALLFSGFFSVLELSLEFVAVGVSPSLMGRLMSGDSLPNLDDLAGFRDLNQNGIGLGVAARARGADSKIQTR